MHWVVRQSTSGMKRYSIVRHLAFVALNTVAAAVSCGVVLGFFAWCDRDTPREYGFDVWASYFTRLVVIAAFANVMLFPIVARFRNWTSRSLGFGASFVVCLLIFSAFIGYVDSNSANSALNWWLFSILAGYGAVYGAPFLGLDLALNYGLRRWLFPADGEV